MRDPKAFTVVGVLAGIGLGGIKVTGRLGLIALVPKERMTEFFGFFTLAGEAASVLGPFLWAATLSLFPDRSPAGYRAGISVLFVVLLFAIGAFLKVRFPAREDGTRGGGSVRRALVRLVRFVVRLFYRRIEVEGLEHVPREGPVLFVANHNNGLVDPMVVLDGAPAPRRLRREVDALEDPGAAVPSRSSRLRAGREKGRGRTGEFLRKGRRGTAALSSGSRPSWSAAAAC